MNRIKLNSFIPAIIICIILANCSSPHTLVSKTPADQQIITSITPQIVTIQPSVTPSPIPSPIPSSPTPSPTIEVLQNPISATVWKSDPLVPIVLYHRYIPYDKTNSSRMKMQLSVFRTQLEQLEKAGFTSVSLSDWLKGNFSVAPGKRPIILSWDDLFFADQIFLNPDGTPSLYSGLGVLWQFNKEFPDFGFKPALFSNMGDKYYANHFVGDWFYTEKGWQESLANVIVWCIENGADVYNHFYDHPSLPKLSPELIRWELQKNDRELLNFLKKAGKEDLAAKLDNVISIPYDRWPPSPHGQSAILDYISLNGKHVLGIVDAEPNYARKLLVSAPYTEGFDHYHIPRFEGQTDNIDQLVADKDLIPMAGVCMLNNPQPALAMDVDYLTDQISQALASGRCSDGVYAVNWHLFRVANGIISEIKMQNSSMVSPSATPAQE